MPPKSPSNIEKLWEIFRFVLSVLLIVIPVRMFVAKPFIVSGASMFPTFSNNEYLIVDELSYFLREPRRGEVVVFRYPKDPSKYFIKRIIGLPGETVILSNGQVTIKNSTGQQVVQEPYVKENNNTDMEAVLGSDEYFVMGDNRGVSHDSRAWGALPKDLITGRAFIRLLPLDRASLLPGDFTAKQ